MLTVKDLGLIHQSIKKRWQIPKETQEQVAAAIKAGLEHENPITKLRAVRCIVELDKLNIQHEKMLMPSLTQINVDVKVKKDEDIDKEIEEIERELKLLEERKLNGTSSSEIIDVEAREVKESEVSDTELPPLKQSGEESGEGT